VRKPPHAPEDFHDLASMADIIAVRGVSGMNHKLDQILMTSALTGWVASIAALLTIGVNPSRSLMPTPPTAVDAHRSFLMTSPLLPLKVAEMQLGNSVVSQELSFATLDGQHWLDRPAPAPNLLNLTDPEASLPPPLSSKF